MIVFTFYCQKIFAAGDGTVLMVSLLLSIKAKQHFYTSDFKDSPIVGKPKKGYIGKQCR